MHFEKIGNTEFLYRQLSLDEVYKDASRLRYEVFCIEKKYIPTSQHLDETETDHFDPYAVHFGAFVSNNLIGYLRLIPCINNVCPPAYPHLEKEISEGKKIFQASRIAITKRFRQRTMDDGLFDPAPYLKISKNDYGMSYFRRVKPMALGLYKEVYMHCKKLDVTHIAALMEPAMWRLLDMMSFPFQRIAGPIEYLGASFVYLLDIKQAEAELKLHHPVYYDYLTSETE